MANAVPIGWKIVELRSIADKRTRKNNSFEYSLILSNSAQQGIIQQTEHFDKEIAVKENIDGYYIVNKGDFVYNPRISATAPCGPIRKNHTGEIGVVSPLYTVFKVRDEKNIYPSFMEYYFLSTGWHKYIKGIANYGARYDRMSISIDGFFSMPIPLPPLSEQRAIAEILTAQDSAIALRERLIAAKRKQKRWLTQNLLTGKVRLPGFEGKWELVKLHAIADKCIRKNSKFDYSLILTNSAKQGILPQTEHFNKEIAIKENIDGYYIVDDGDFVYNPRISVTAPCGPIRKNHIGRTGIVSPLYTVFKVRSEEIYNLFIEHYFFSTGWHRYIRGVANYGARHDRMNISIDDFFAIPIPLPPLSEQTAIAEVLTAQDREIELLSRELEGQRQVKKYLSGQLLTGRIRTPR